MIGNMSEEECRDLYDFKTDSPNHTSDDDIYTIAHAILDATVYTTPEGNDISLVYFLIDSIDTEDIDGMFGKGYKEYGGEATFEIGCVAAKAAIEKYKELQNAK